MRTWARAVRAWMTHVYAVSKLMSRKNMQILLEHAYTQGRVDVVNEAVKARKQMNRRARRGIAKKRRHSVADALLPE